MIVSIKNIIKDRGFILAFLLSSICLFYFYGNLLININYVYFSANGDGLQSYYSAIYHVKYDPSFWKMEGMNYPYGEQVFFTGCHPFISNIIKLISYVVDISDYTVGILNLIMLLSIVLCALSIYLIFKHLRLPSVYSAIAATAIAFLSPQINRLGGHFSLTYQFAIPLLFLLLLKFNSAPSFKKSFLIGILTFFIAGTQFYFLGFFAIIQLFFWLMYFVSSEKNLKNIKFISSHVFIQLIAPFIFIQLIIVLIDPVSDRTHLPWGYLIYISNLTGVFYPSNGRFYTPVFESFIKPEFMEWEGHGFVGFIAVIVFLAILIAGLKHLLNKNYRAIFKTTDNKVLNAFLLSGIIALLLAFGYPFIIKGYESWLHYAGPLKQLRGIGRFVWVFYYIINIIAFYKIHNWLNTKKTFITYSGYCIVLFFVSYDAFVNTYGKQGLLNHSIPELSDTTNKLPENQWLSNIKADHYQAIISLPYFHIGSENIMLSTESDIVKYAFITAIKTGLPLVPITLSRTSLSQTYKNVQLIKEPYRPLEIMNDFKNTKPFLILVRENELNEDEQHFLSKCKKIQETPQFNIYELEIETLKNIHHNLYSGIKKQLAKTKTFHTDPFLSTDSLKTFIYNGFEDMINSTNFIGQGSYNGKLKEHNLLYKGAIPAWKDQEYIFSFWINDFTTDLYPRSTVEIAFLDSTEKAYNAEYFNLGNNFCVLDGKWALIERKFRLRNKSDKVSVTIWNENIIDDKKNIQVDELLIRPSNTKLFNSSEHKITFNNRTYQEIK